MNIFFNSKNFIELRKAKKISQKEMAYLLNVTRTALYYWESGKRIPQANDIRIMAQILEVPVSEISNLVKLATEPKTISEEIDYNIRILDKIHETFGNNTPSFYLEPLIRIQKSVDAISQQLETSKKNNRRLLKSSRQLNKVLDSLTSFIYIKNIRGVVKTVNRTFLDSYEILENEIQGKTFLEFFGSRDKSLSAIEVSENIVIQTKTGIIDRKITIPGKNNKRIGLLSVVPVFDERGRITETISSIKDTTALLKDLEKDNFTIKYILNNSIDGIWINDDKKKYLFYNKAMEKIHGWTKSELNSGYATWEDFVHKDELERVKKNLEEAGTKTSRDVWHAVHKNGSIKLVEVIVFWKKYEGKQYCCGITRDITETEEYQKVKNYKNFFEQILNCIDAAVWICTFDKDFKRKKYIYINKAIETLYGRKRKSFEKNTSLWEKCLHPDDKEKVLNITSDKSGYPKQCNYRIIRPDKTVRFVQETLFCIEHDNVRFFGGIEKDITKNKKS